MREELSDVFRNPLMWVAAGAAFCISAGAVLLVPRAKEPVQRVSSTPAATVPDVRIAQRPSLPSGPTSQATSPEELPLVKIRTVAKKVEQPGPSDPHALPGVLSAEVAVAGSRQGNPGGAGDVNELPPLDETQVPVLPHEPGALPPPAPPVTITPAEPVRVPVPVERNGEVPAPPTVRQPERSVQRPRQSTGLLTIFFDADSTTFDRERRRLPLRVEVWVNGALKARSSDPEKRDLEIGLLPAGWHEVEVVPYVGDLPSQPRKRSVLIEPGTTVEYRAVLRREDGVGRVAKFRPRG